MYVRPAKFKSMRTEKDYIGEKQIPDNALYGIHAIRASENFPDNTRFHIEWFQAIGKVKEACYKTYQSFKKAVYSKYGTEKSPVKFNKDDIIEAMLEAANEVSQGMYFDHYLIPALSGGAGTSINMNVNEIITNAALRKLGYQPGDYHIIDPIEQANIYQSTNDVIPTSLKLALMLELGHLETAINTLRAHVEGLENTYRNDLRAGYAQMQQAVPSSYGKLFSTYSEALSRDWWRVSKCFERIKVVNLGGSAIGTSLAVPRFFVLEVVSTLQKLTGLPITRSENLPDATANLDNFVEVHAILKSHAVNLEKMLGDLRLLASDVVNNPELELPQKQPGSSIMPGKVNPVIPEYVIGSVHKIYSNDQLVSSLAGQGCLELNAYIPSIGHAMIDSIKLLTGANKTLAENLFDGLKVHSHRGMKKLLHSPAITTALGPYIGYNKAARLAKHMKEKGEDIYQANKALLIMDDKKLQTILKPGNLLKGGYSIKDLMDEND